MLMIEQLRTRQDYQAQVAKAIERELQLAQEGKIAAVSSKTAAFYLGKHKDTLREWRQPPPKGPPFDKGSDGIGANNEHVSYPWSKLVEWKDARAGKTAKERKLRDELERLLQRTRELNLELQLQDARDHAAKLAKKLGRKLGFSTLADCTEPEDWVSDGQCILGHVLTVDAASLTSALDDDQVVSASLADVLRMPWAWEARAPFVDAWERVLKDQVEAIKAGDALGDDLRSRRGASGLASATTPVHRHGERRTP